VCFGSAGGAVKRPTIALSIPGPGFISPQCLHCQVRPRRECRLPLFLSQNRHRGAKYMELSFGTSARAG
jgi:hypothetical protein